MMMKPETVLVLFICGIDILRPDQLQEQKMLNGFCTFLKRASAPEDMGNVLWAVLVLCSTHFSCFTIHILHALHVLHVLHDCRHV